MWDTFRLAMMLYDQRNTWRATSPWGKGVTPFLANVIQEDLTTWDLIAHFLALKRPFITPLAQVEAFVSNKG